MGATKQDMLLFAALRYMHETHNYFASVFNNGRMVDGGDLPIDFRTNAIIGPNVQFLNKGKETYWHFLTSS